MRFRIILVLLIFAVLYTSCQAQTIEAREAFRIGYEYLKNDQPASAIKSFKLVLEDPFYPLHDYAYYYSGKAYQDAASFKYAITTYKIVPKHFGNSVLAPRALFGIAKCQMELGERAEAILALRELISNFPKHDLIPEARYLLGINLEKIGKYEDAARVYRNLDLLHSDSDFAEKSIERLDRLAKGSSLALYEAPAATIYNLGIKYYNKRNYVKAKEYFTRLTKFYRKSSFYDEAFMMLGRIQLRNGKLKTAAHYFNKTINLNKDSKPEAMYYLALTHAYLDKPNAALLTLEKIISRYPNHHAADNSLFYMGRLYQLLNATPEAVQAYERLVDSYPNSPLFPDALWLVGNFSYKQGDFNKAYVHFSKSFSLPPEKASDQLIFWAGKCAEKIGETEKAIAAYQATVYRYDHSYYAYRARDELQKYGISIPANDISQVSLSVTKINGENPETADHEQKYRELMALGLGDEAAEEAEFIAQKVPKNKKDKADLARYHALVMKGKFSQPIWFADKKIDEAMLSGNLSGVDPRLWRFSYPRGYWTYVEKYAKQYALDPYLVYAVIREESRFKSQALSRSWAHGLMQIIPSTARKISRELGIRYSRWKLYNPRVNIQMGTYYLSQLIRRFGGNISYALAGYNGGPVRVKKWLEKYNSRVDIDEFIEDIPLRETRKYVKRVMKSYYGYKRTYAGE